MADVRALALIVVVLLVPAVAVAASPPAGVHHTTAGTAAARRALLRAVDLGAGWSDGSTPKKVGALTCTGVARTVAGVVEVGSAVSATYRQSASGPFLSQAVFVYGSAAQAALFWRHVSGRTALSCLATNVAAGSTKDVRFTVKHRAPLAAPAGTGSAAYRVVGQAKTTLQDVVVYVDVELVIRGNSITELSWSSFAAPAAVSLEHRVARAAAGRL
jgi:hypothetical protein